MHVYEGTITYTKTLFQIDGNTLNTPEKAYQYLKDIAEQFPYQETLWAILLDNKSHALFRIMLTKGTLTSSLVSPREVFSPAIISGAASVILAHNHPSGCVDPSSADVQVTRAIRQAGEILNIPLVDHLILGHPDMNANGKAFYSFREAGLV